MSVRLPLLLVALLGVAGPSVALAQTASENAEARVYFQEGNRLYEQSSRARGEQRTALLRRSLEAYVDSLRIVRSRNALFNAAVFALIAIGLNVVIGQAGLLDLGYVGFFAIGAYCAALFSSR